MFGKKNRQVDKEFFTIYDSKTDSYVEPVLATNQHDLARQMMNLFERQGSENKYYQNAEDYSLFKIGDYCHKTGSIASHEPKHVLNLHELRSAVERKVSEKQGLNGGLEAAVARAAQATDLETHTGH